MADDPMPAWAEALANTVRNLRADVLAELTATRADIMDRIDRLQNRVDEQAGRIMGAVNLAAAADAAAGDFGVASLERDLARSKQIALYAEQTAALTKQVAQLQDQLRGLREGKAP